LGERGERRWRSGSSLALQTPIRYEPYSWQEPNGGWNFCLLPSPSGVNIPAEAVIDKRCLLRGVNRLSQKMSRLPVGATIDWLDRILGNGHKAERLKASAFHQRTSSDKFDDTLKGAASKSKR
jgi:hypothetical protein